MEKEIGQQGLSACNETLTKNFNKVSNDLDDMRTKSETLSDERARLLGQIDCLQTQLAARDQSLVEFLQTQGKLHQIQSQLAEVMIAFDVQDVASSAREKEFLASVPRCVDC